MTLPKYWIQVRRWLKPVRWNSNYSPGYMGPLPNQKAWQQCVALRNVLHDGAPLEDAFTVEVSDEIASAMELLIERIGWNDSWTWSQWRRAMIKLWWQWRIRRAEKLLADEEEEDDFDENENETKVEEPFKWDPETICWYWRRQMVELMEQVYNGRWIRRMSNASVSWQESASQPWKNVVLSAGEILAEDSSSEESK